jgi:hypothetical protein
MVLAFLALTVIGVALLVTVLALFSRKDFADDRASDQRKDFIEPEAQSGQDELEKESYRGPAARSEQDIPGGEPASQDAGIRPPVSRETGGTSQQRYEPAAQLAQSGHQLSPEAGEEGYIPVLHPKHSIPGLKSSEQVHFLSSGTLYSLDTTSGLEEVEVCEGMNEELKGELVVTSGRVMLYNEQNSKQFTFSSIEQHRAHGSHLFIKRKNVKKKKDIIEVGGNPVEFQYIVRLLLS